MDDQTPAAAGGLGEVWELLVDRAAGCVCGTACVGEVGGAPLLPQGRGDGERLGVMYGPQHTSWLQMQQCQEWSKGHEHGA